MCHGKRSDLFVEESLGRVVPACSSEPCESAGGYFSNLFLVNTSGCREGIQVCRPVKAERDTNSPTPLDNYFKRKLMHVDMKEVYVYQHERGTL